MHCIYVFLFLLAQYLGAPVKKQTMYYYRFCMTEAYEAEIFTQQVWHGNSIPSNNKAI